MFAEDSLSLIFFYISSIFLLQIYLFEKHRFLQVFVQKLSPIFLPCFSESSYVNVCQWTYSFKEMKRRQTVNYDLRLKHTSSLLGLNNFKCKTNESLL